MSTKNPLCLRLPDDLQAAVVQMAQQSGVSLSEWIRDLLFHAAYGEPLGMSEGYIQGRSIGYRTMLLACKEAWAAVPDSVDDAVTALQGPSRSSTDRANAVAVSTVNRPSKR